MMTQFLVTAGKKRPLSRGGFSLAEMLVAIAIMGLLLDVFVVLFRTTVQSAAQTDYQSNAQTLANSILSVIGTDLRQSVRIVSPLTATPPSFPVQGLALEPPASTPLACSDGDFAGNAAFNCGGFNPNACGNGLPKCVAFSLDANPTKDIFTYWYGTTQGGSPVIWMEESNNGVLVGPPFGFGRVRKFISDPKLTISNFEVRTLYTQASVSVVIAETARYNALVSGTPLADMMLQHKPLPFSTYTFIRYYQ